MANKMEVSFKRAEYTEDDIKKEALKKSIAMANVIAFLSKKKDTEMRIDMKMAEDIGIDLSDDAIIKMFEQGIVVDVVIRNARKDDCLPARLEKIRKDIIDDHEGFVRVKIVDRRHNAIFNGSRLVGIFMGELSSHDFRVSTQDEGDDFITLRISTVDKKGYLTAEEINKLLSDIMGPGHFDITVVPWKVDNT